MSVLYVMLPVAMLLAASAVWLFVRAVHQGQYDDLDTPAERMLLEDDRSGPVVDRPETEHPDTPRQC